MRCPYCGSKMLYPDIQHKHFSTGKAVAGAVTFGVIGAATGFIGKDTKGYRCSACGAFSETSMPLNIEYGINNAVRDAEEGRNSSVYQQLKKKYPNIETVTLSSANTQNMFIAPNAILPTEIKQEVDSKTEAAIVKHTYMPRVFVPKCPLYVERAVIKATPTGDVLSLAVWNISAKTIRSAYFTVRVLDDVGDEVSTKSCVYQGLSTGNGSLLPSDKEFRLDTDIAYKVEIRADKAAFDDDSVWRADEDAQECMLSEQSEILPENFPKYPYLRALLGKKSTLPEEERIFQPIFEETFVQCICGLPMDARGTCVRCGLNEKKLSEILSYDVLTAYQHKIVKTIAEKRTKAVQKLYISACQSKYKKALALQQKDTKEALVESKKIFRQISDYEDSLAQIEICKAREKVIDERLETERIAAEKAAEERRAEEARLAEERRIAAEKARAEREAQEKAKEEKARRNITAASITLFSAVVIALFLALLFTVIIPNAKYNKAVECMGNGDYLKANELFQALGEYKNCTEMSQEALYQQALLYWNAKDYDESNKIFEQINSYKDSQSKIHIHKYTSVVTEKATCAKKGVATYSCTTCNSSYTEAIELMAHNYVEKVTVKPTCTQAGKKTLTCKNCKQANEESVKATGHSYKGTITKAATCDVAGVKTFSCHCGEKYTEAIKATGHKYSSSITKNATCDVNGVKTFKCSCGKSYTESIKATGHNYSEATCTKAATCNKCKKTNGKALGHSIADKVCSRCKYNFMEPITFTVEDKASSIVGIGPINTTGVINNIFIPRGTYKVTVVATHIKDPEYSEPYNGDYMGGLMEVGSVDIKIEKNGTYTETWNVYSPCDYFFYTAWRGHYAVTIEAVN